MKTTCSQFIRFLGCGLCLFAVFLLGPSHCLGQASAPATTALGAFAPSFQGPVRVAADAAGRIYVSDRTAGQVLILDAFGRPISTSPRLASPLAVAVDSRGRIYVSEERNGSVSVFDAQWNLLLQFGQGVGEFSLPSHIAIDPTTGVAFVCDSAASQIKTYQGSQPGVVFGGYGSGQGQFDFPAGVWVNPAGEVFVVDQNNNRVQVFDRGGLFKRLFSLIIPGGGLGLGSNVSGRFQGITGDSHGRIYIADSFQGQVQVFDVQGNFLSTIGSYGDKAGQFRLPVGLAADSLGRLLVTSANNRRLELIGLDSFIHLVAVPTSQLIAAGGQAAFSASVSGPGTFTFQWRKGTNNLVNDTGISGATLPTLALTSVTTNDSGAYSVVISGPSGPFTSPEAILTVVNPPTILSQPASQSVLAGTPASIVVSASGDSLSYQWLLDGGPLAGATGPSLAFASTQPADAGSYSVTLSNAVGVLISDAATLTVVSRPSPPEFDPFSFQPDGSLRLFFHGDSGFTYAIETSSDLATWTTLATAFSADGAIEYFDTDAAANPLRFYRVRWLP
jgi:DNA-binding beta-propeller fold protein YncE